MVLDPLNFLGLRKNLEQFVISQEIEPREFSPLSLQVAVKPLLDFVQ